MCQDSLCRPLLYWECVDDHCWKFGQGLMVVSGSCSGYAVSEIVHYCGQLQERMTATCPAGDTGSFGLGLLDTNTRIPSNQQGTYVPPTTATEMESSSQIYVWLKKKEITDLDIGSCIETHQKMSMIILVRYTEETQLENGKGKGIGQHNETVC